MERKIKFVRKTFIVSMILLMQAVLIYAYYTQENFLANFKWDYIKQVYLPAYQYEWNNSQLFHGTEGISQSQAAGPNEKAIPVLLYHGIVEREDTSNISVDTFRDQMMALKKAGYSTVTMQDFWDFVQGNKELPDKSFLLTFDDGRKDSYYPVDPILKALDYNAVMFVITRYINAENDHFYLSRQELQNMLDSKRWELEAHTKEGHDMITIDSNDQKGHYYSNKIWNAESGLESDRDYGARVFNDLTGAKNDLENEFGIKVLSFAFPFGDYGQSTLNYPESKEKILDITHYAYPITFYQVTIGNSYMFNYAGSDESSYKRINVQPEWSGNDLLAFLKAGQSKELPIEDNFTNQIGWFGSSARNEITNEGLRLRPPVDSTSGTMFLEGSKAWRDYTYTSYINWIKGNRLSLLAHYRDNTNYLSCEISDQYIQLVSEIGGENKLLGEIQIPLNLDKRYLKVTLRVDGDKLACSLNDSYTAEFTGISNEQSFGGVGVRISDNQLGNGEINLQKVTVTNNGEDNPDQKAVKKNINNQVGSRNNLFYNDSNGIFKPNTTR